MWRPLRHTAGDLAGTLPLASWAHAVGASSVMRSVLGSELQGACLSSRPRAVCPFAPASCVPCKPSLSSKSKVFGG